MYNTTYIQAPDFYLLSECFNQLWITHLGAGFQFWMEDYTTIGVDEKGIDRAPLVFFEEVFNFIQSGIDSNYTNVSDK